MWYCVWMLLVVVCLGWCGVVCFLLLWLYCLLLGWCIVLVLVGLVGWLRSWMYIVWWMLLLGRLVLLLLELVWCGSCLGIVRLLLVLGLLFLLVWCRCGLLLFWWRWCCWRWWRFVCFWVGLVLFVWFWCV